MARVVIYTTSYCPYCTAAKALLRSKNAGFEEIATRKGLAKFGSPAGGSKIARHSLPATRVAAGSDCRVVRRPQRRRHSRIILMERLFDET